MIIVASLLIPVPGAYGLGIRVTDMHGEPSQNIQPFALNFKMMVLAENEPGVAESHNQTVTRDQNQTAAPKSAGGENTGKQADEGAAKPLKPFRPSEEIAADQAVDFPVDI